MDVQADVDIDGFWLFQGGFKDNFETVIPHQARTEGPQNCGSNGGEI